MKRIYLVMLLFVYILPNTATAKKYDASQLPIVVRNVPEWSGEYLTVINNWKGKMVRSVKGELPPLLSVITSINGNDARGMTEDTFCEFLMSQGKSTIAYLEKNKGTNVKKQCTISYYTSIYWAEGITMDSPVPFPENIKMTNIKSASAFSFNTFSYKTGNVDEINEKAVLEAAGKSLEKLGFIKSEEVSNSDMILSLSKTRDEYNGNAIVMSVLDGKKLREGIERVIWTLEVSDLGKELKTQETAIKTALNKFCNNFPFDQPTYSQSITTIGIAFENEQMVSSGKILRVLQGTDAYNKGLRDGDAILGAYAGYTTSFIWTKTRRYYFKPNKRDRKKNWGLDLLLILPIIPQFTFNNSEHYLTDYSWRGGGDSKNHFKVRNSFGKKLTMNAPFDESTFNFKFIR